MISNLGYCQTDTSYLKKYVKYLSTLPEIRSAKNYQTLKHAAFYINSILKDYSTKMSEQLIEIDNKKYKNIIASYGPQDAPRIIIGAHYDACNISPGADDNASGIAGLLELARQLQTIENKLVIRIDLVAYTLEEPPYFNTKNMGSYIHAKSLKDENVQVLGMLNLECIGFFSDKKHTQRFPFKLMKLRYGTQGNFIALVQKNTQGIWANYMKNQCKRFANKLKVVSIKPPVPFFGMDFSDHKNYWEMGYDAIMITNTAFYRNKNYHQLTDTYETLDYIRMAEVVDMVYKSMLYYNR
jgi:hypothetical protein